MRFSKFLVVSTGVAAIAIVALVSQANAADGQQAAAKQPVAKAQVQTPARAAQPAQATAQRRTYRSYSYEPQYNNGNFGRSYRGPTWARADSKVKFRYGSFPY
ncbi:MAG TPA: hypothetical protein VGJ26_05740 [Pirellulales bacterium]